MSYQIEAFNALTEPQQTFVKKVVYSVIKKWGRVCPHDLANHVRDEVYDYMPSNWKSVTDHTYAACWKLEEEKKVIRTKNRSAEVILVLA